MISPVAKRRRRSCIQESSPSPLYCIWGLKTRFRFEGDETVTGDPRRHGPVSPRNSLPSVRSRPVRTFLLRPSLAPYERAGEGNKLMAMDLGRFFLCIRSRIDFVDCTGHNKCQPACPGLHLAINYATVFERFYRTSLGSAGCF